MSEILQVRVGRRIAKARLAADLTQVQLAAKLNASLRAVQTWEYGERHPRKLEQIAAVTGRPVHWFFEDGDEDESEAAAA